MAARAVVELHRRRPQNRHRFDIVRLGEIETRRHAGIAGRAPIGFPSRLQLERDTAEQHPTAARSSIANAPTNRVAAKPTAARIGTMTVMRHLYRLALS